MIDIETVEELLHQHEEQGNVLAYVKHASPGKRPSRTYPKYTVVLTDGTKFEAVTGRELVAFATGLEAYAAAQRARDEATAERRAAEAAAAEERRKLQREFDVAVVESTSCPFCSAPQGSRCTVDSPHYSAHPHSERVDAHLSREESRALAA